NLGFVVGGYHQRHRADYTGCAGDGVDGVVVATVAVVDGVSADGKRLAGTRVLRVVGFSQTSHRVGTLKTGNRRSGGSTAVAVVNLGISGSSDRQAGCVNHPGRAGDDADAVVIA